MNKNYDFAYNGSCLIGKNVIHGVLHFRCERVVAAIALFSRPSSSLLLFSLLAVVVVVAVSFTLLL